VHLDNEVSGAACSMPSERLRSPRLTVSAPKAALASLLLQPATAAQSVEAKQVMLTGDESVLATYGALIEPSN
jgi:hypothetical protein